MTNILKILNEIEITQIKMQKIQTKKFNELSLNQLYQLLKLRFDVFVFEQQSIYNEFDNLDFQALHFFIEKQDYIVVYSRLYKKNDHAVLGRIVVKKEFRDAKLGKLIINECIKYVKQQWALSKIRISAQTHLKKFYVSFGFKVVSNEYDDGGIMHHDMELILD